MSDYKNQIMTKKDYEERIGDLILCDPITSKGKNALSNIKLTGRIDEQFFFDNLYVSPIYEEIDPGKFSFRPDEYFLLHSYTLQKEHFEFTKNIFKIFKDKLLDNNPSNIPLIMMGTAGNGKSVEVLHTIYKLKTSREDSLDSVYLNFEESKTEVPYFGADISLGTEQTKDSRWLACIILIESLLKTIKSIKEKCYIPYVFTNFQDRFQHSGKYKEMEKKFFDILNKTHNIFDTELEKELFLSIKEFLAQEDPILSLLNLLELYMLLLYCYDPNCRNYIIFDNLENYINVGESKIIIPNKVLGEIYDTCLFARNNLKDRFENANLFGASFKIILVLRRTSVNILMNGTMQNTAQLPEKTNDYTGFFEIWQIWNNKKRFVKSLFLNEFKDPNFIPIINILDLLMEDNQSKVIGNPYQSYISELMNSSLRRNARAQAYTAVEVFHLIKKNRLIRTININEFNKLTKKRNENRYMLRAALMQIQFKRMINSKSCAKRNELLHIL